MSRKTIPRETEKPKKLTRAQKKEIDAVIRKYKGDGKPRTAQATIPYEAIYPDGVCRIDRRTFSKCIAFEDISYQLAQPETRTAIFEHLCDLYNYVDASIHVQLSFLNRKVDPVPVSYTHLTLPTSAPSTPPSCKSSLPAATMVL